MCDNRRLNREEFLKRTEDLFPSFYLMIISIIQGVAFGFLAQKFFEIETISIQDVYYSIVTLFILSMVLYEYSTAVAIFRWAPKFIDVMIPFAIGSVEFLMIAFIDKPLYWYGYGTVFFVCAIIAYVNTLRNISRDNFEASDLGEEIFRSSKKTTKLSIFLSLFGFIYCSGVYWVIRYYPNMADNKIFLFILFIIILIYVWKEQKWFVNLYKQILNR